MPSVSERLFAACCKLCAAIVAVTPIAILALLVWAALTLTFEANGRVEFSGWLAVVASTIVVSLIAAILGGALGAGAAFAAEELSSTPVRRTIEGAIGFFGAIPSVAFGWFAATVIVPATATNPLGFVTPYAVAAAVLTVMTAPTACALVMRGLPRVPTSVRFAAAAAGATRLQTTAFVVVPALRRRIAIAGLAAFARSIGKATAMQVLYAALAREGVRATPTAAATVFARLALGPPAADPSYYIAALVLLCVAAVCVLAVGREVGGPQWA